MSLDPTSAALASLSVADARLRAHLRKLHASHQHTFLPWRHLSAQHLEQLAGAPNARERREMVRRMLKLAERFPPGEVHVRDVSGTASQQAASLALSRSMVDPNLTRQEIVLDLALGVLGFCWTHDLDALKTSTFFSILYTVHQHVSEVAGPQPSAPSAWAFFEHQLLRHSVERPPFSIACFAQPEVTLLSEFALQTYFAQLKLYQYAFGTANELDIHPTNGAAECVQPTTIGLPMFATTGEAVQEEWQLEHAKNYFPMTNNSMVSAAAAAAGADGAEDGEVASSSAHGTSDGSGDEFRDDVNGLAFLNASASAALRDIGSAASASAAASGAALLADPAEQALFDQAIAREMVGMYADFGAQLAKQQEIFTRRLTELDPTAAATATTTNGNPAARNGALAMSPHGANGRRKSRGK